MLSIAFQSFRNEIDANQEIFALLDSNGDIFISLYHNFDMEKLIIDADLKNEIGPFKFVLIN